jgi:hypothetical protein
MAVLNNSNAISPSGYDVNNSLRFRSSASAYLNRTPASAGNRTTWTWSAWVKRGTIDSGASQYFLFSAYTASTDAGYTAIFISADTLRLSGHNTTYRTTTQVFRDPSAWYHLVVVWDTTQGTASNRIKMYINGSQVTAFSTSNDPTSSQTSGVNAAGAHAIGANSNTLGVSNFDGYLADVNFIDGSAKTPSDFGETDTTTGVWKPKAYTGTYGTNGFYLKFSDIATTSGSNAGLGKDFSGNTNYWTTNNISVTSGTTYDAMKDSPTNTSATVANYCVLSPLDYKSVAPQQANLYVPATDYAFVRGTFWASTGKWYYEWTSSAGGGLPPYVGVAAANITSYLGVTTSGISWYGHSDAYIKPFTATASIAATALASGDIVGVAFDCDAGTIRYYKNNTLVYTDTTLTVGALVSPVLLSTFGGGAWNNATFNFGQRPFSYTPPTGYVALNTYNLPTPTILQGNKYMDATLYTGTGTALNVVNAGQFKPDFVWAKNRTSADSSGLYDSVRGVNQRLISNLTNAEDTSSGVSAFNSNGFSLGTAANYNTNGNAYVGWQWQAGQGSTSSNTSGSITSTVSVNTTAGFSIVTYTGTGANATVGHGLGVAPSMMIIKQRNSAQSWSVYHASLGATKRVYLDLTDAVETTTTAWNSTTPTSSVYSVGTSAATNGNGNTFVAYCWAEIAGFSKFGSYTGNGSSDGVFVYLGFRPKYFLLKRTDTGGYEWYVFDTARNTYNAVTNKLYPNLSNAEDSLYAQFDFVSNGIKIRDSRADWNGNGATYIYAAFAESPFKNSLAR